MKIYSVSSTNFLPKTSCKRSINHVSPNFQGKHTFRNTGIGIGSAVGIVGFGLWNLATGGIPLLVGILAAGGTAAAGAFGDAMDKTIEEEEKKNKKP